MLILHLMPRFNDNNTSRASEYTGQTFVRYEQYHNLILLSNVPLATGRDIN
jgi:hypothetical protein